MQYLEQYPQLELIRQLARKRKVSVYLVGGFLRDAILGRDNCDLDFAVDKDALKLARAFAQKVRGAYVLLDEERGCARVVKNTQRGALTFDFADYRAKTLKGDLAHRDFTINTLCLNLLDLDEAKPEEAKMIDQLNAARDIKRKTIKLVSLKAFREDPLRMMRAFSLQAVLGFTIEKITYQQIRKDKALLVNVSYERIRDELFKVLCADDTAAILRSMDKAGLLEVVIPQVKVMYDCQQGGYHHLDVWPHSLEALAQFDEIMKSQIIDDETRRYLNEEIAGKRPRYAIIKLALLLHDIGKPDTRKIEEGKYSFHGHERVGRDIVRHIARFLKLSTDERHRLEDMVFWHLRPGYLSNFKHPSERSIFRYFRDTKKEAVSILLLSLADQRATLGPLTTEADQKHHEAICLDLVGRYFAKLREKPFVRLINGDDLIKKLKLKESPLIGKLLKEIEEQQNLGKVTTRQAALALAQTILKKPK